MSGDLPLGCSQTMLDDELSGEAHGFDPPLYRAYLVDPDHIWRARLRARDEGDTDE